MKITKEELGLLLYIASHGEYKIGSECARLYSMFYNYDKMPHEHLSELDLIEYHPEHGDYYRLTDKGQIIVDTLVAVSNLSTFK